MTDYFTYDVFLHHSSKDLGVARAIAERLRADGLRVWFDEWEIPLVTGESRLEGPSNAHPDHRYAEKIEEGLRRSRVMVLCMSENAFGSEWPQLEADTFRFRYPATKDRHLIPLRLDGTPIKPSMARLLYINWLPEEREQGYAKLLEACWPLADQATVEAQPMCEQQAEHGIKLDYEGSSCIWAYVFSPDEKRALTAADDATVRLWDVETGCCLRVFEGHEDTVYSVAWSADQRRALSGSKDETLRLWDVETGRCLRVGTGRYLRANPGHAWINCVAWSPDERHALSGSTDHTLRLWDVETGRCMRVFDGHTDSVTCVVWSADQRRFLSAAADNTLRLWDVQTGRFLRVLKGPTDERFNSFHSVAWSADQRQVLAGDSHGTLRLWDVETGRCLRVLLAHRLHEVLGVAWNADQRHALSCSSDMSVRLWNLELGRCLCVLIGHNDEVIHVKWSANKPRVLSGDRRGGIREWNLAEIVT